ncbi:Delta(14)-sterol reductase [Capsicum annuum]|uniref:Delta(14)-sterol reductase n=1 Tax=Capsicum annuum TaxID=4072 RepID=A0A2G2YPL6_CAPAN|nr:Delta(14)-sterol reductase [Capsicum annuum]
MVYVAWNLQKCHRVRVGSFKSSTFLEEPTQVAMLLSFFLYLATVGSILPGKLVPGVTLSDGTRLHYRCNGLLSLLLLVLLLGVGSQMNLVSPTAIADRGLELLSTTFIFSVLVTLMLYLVGLNSRAKSSSLKPHVSGNLIHDWWFGIQLNPEFMGIDLKFFFVRAGMMGWLLINLSVLAKCIIEDKLSQSMILYQIFCGLYILDYFFYEEFMTSTISSPPPPAPSLFIFICFVYYADLKSEVNHIHMARVGVLHRWVRGSLVSLYGLGQSSPRELAFEVELGPRSILYMVSKPGPPNSLFPMLGLPSYIVHALNVQMSSPGRGNYELNVARRTAV